jgi:hypothetical protein
MQFFINELSFIGQAQNDYEAEELMIIFAELIKKIQPLQGDYPIRTCSDFASKLLSSTINVHQWLINCLNSKDENRRIRARLFLQIITKGPFIDLQGELHSCECHFNNKNVSLSSLSGVAKFKGVLLSLQKNLDFESQNLEVMFRIDNNLLEKNTIHNLTAPEHANMIRPIYQLYRKHAPQEYWVDATPMDLTNEEAQKILDNSLKNTNDNSKKRYGYSKIKDKFYAFQSDNTDEQGYLSYHGYPIDETEVPCQIKKKLLGED